MTQKKDGIIIIADKNMNPDALILVTDGKIVDVKIVGANLALVLVNIEGGREKMINKLQKELDEGKLDGEPRGGTLAELVDDKASAMAEAKTATIN